jgi:hypothetical protein
MTVEPFEAEIAEDVLARPFAENKQAAELGIDAGRSKDA